MYDALATQLTGPLVAAEESETVPLAAAQNYIAWLATTGLDQPRGSTPPGGANTLLFVLLRHALLRAYATAALRIVRSRGLAAPGEGTEPGLGDNTPTPTPWSRLAAPLDGVKAPAQTLGEHLDAVRTAGKAGSSPAAAELTELLELQTCLRRLAGLPTAALARYAGGALAIASHRLDAWVSAHATRRLGTLRTRRPQGLRLGGYGVLEDVGPAPPQAATHGYIHAPSLGQAATAAVLRSGHLAHQRDTSSPLAVDLSSSRVRLALTLLDGVRAGQPLGALLGYRLERGLHEQHPGLALDRYIDPLRRLAPLDEQTKAQHDLDDAITLQTDAQNALDGKLNQLDVLRARDPRPQLELQIRAALTELEVALRNANQASRKLQTAQEQQEDPEPGVATKANRDAFEAERALDAANRAAAAAATQRDNLRGQQQAAGEQFEDQTDQMSKQQADLESASDRVTEATAHRDEVRAREPPVSEALRANNVADGLALRRRWRARGPDGPWDQTTIPFGDVDAGLPAFDSEAGRAIDAELRALDDAVDALGDLLLAERVHQLVHGNPQRAGATVDALSRGDGPPPDVEVVRTPRAGTGVTHRLLVLADPQARADGWPTDSSQVRALVEPALEAWTASILGPAGVPADAVPQLDLQRDTAWSTAQLGLAEFLELARSVRELLDGARAGRPRPRATGPRPRPWGRQRRSRGARGHRHTRAGDRALAAGSGDRRQRRRGATCRARTSRKARRARRSDRARGRDKRARRP